MQRRLRPFPALLLDVGCFSWWRYCKYRNMLNLSFQSKVPSPFSISDIITWKLKLPNRLLCSDRKAKKKTCNSRFSRLFLFRFSRQRSRRGCGWWFCHLRCCRHGFSRCCGWFGLRHHYYNESSFRDIVRFKRILIFHNLPRKHQFLTTDIVVFHFFQFFFQIQNLKCWKMITANQFCKVSCLSEA